MQSEQEAPYKVSNMTYTELIGFLHMQIGRVEMTWHRVIYLHAAIVGVLVFFGEANQSYLMQRWLVFCFYTVNLLIFYFSLREGYQALREVHTDLKRFPSGDGNVETWFRNRRYAHKSPIRVAVLAITWAMIGLLLFRGWIFG